MAVSLPTLATSWQKQLNAGSDFCSLAGKELLSYGYLCYWNATGSCGSFDRMNSDDLSFIKSYLCSISWPILAITKQLNTQFKQITNEINSISQWVKFLHLNSRELSHDAVYITQKQNAYNQILWSKFDFKYIYRHKMQFRCIFI